MFTDIRYICGRDNYSCVFCEKDCSEKFHISQLDSGDNWNASNLVITCQEGYCNGSKKQKFNLPSDQVKGRLVVASGPMFSEKTTITRSLINKYKQALGNFLWVKPSRDDRGTGITTHNKEEIPAHIISWERPDKHLSELFDSPIVAFDEVQFYSERILFVIHQLLKQGVLVIVNGLRLDFQRNHFGIMHYLLAEADDILALKAVCNSCGMIDVATRTKKRSHSGPSVETGGSDKYFSVCPNCDSSDINLKF